MTRRLAVTGVDGFVGRHVATLATAAGFDVVGIGRKRLVENLNLSAYHAVDLIDGWPGVGQVDAVVHLAALSSVGPSFQEPRRYIDSNAAMTINVCEALLKESPGARLVVASTGALYAPSSSPIAEDGVVAFSSPYAVSKATVENLISYFTGRGVDAVVARPFNHIGPGQRLGFLVPDLINRLRTLPPGRALEVGNLDARRDYTDVRDVAAAYLLLVSAAAPPHRLYNISSGISRSGSEVLAAICAAMGRSVPEVVVTHSRPIEVPSIVGEAARIRRDLGWEQRYDFYASIADAVAKSGDLPN